MNSRTKTDSAHWDIHGYALVSNNDCIAGADGVMPDRLHNDADWAYFQAELALADAVVLGRVSHEATPNASNRLRIILSRRVNGLVQGSDGWWWNPTDTDVYDVLQKIVPGGGRIAVPGGRAPFDLFLKTGFDAFHFACAHHVEIAGGVPVFTDCQDGTSAKTVLERHWMVADTPIELDPDGPVTLTIWRGVSR